MKIIESPNLLSTLKNKYLLLDTNVFIDAFSNPKEFGLFFNELKSNETSLVTVDLIKTEFLKGAFNKTKYTEKLEFIEEIIDTCLPMTQDILDYIYELILMYKEDGKGVSFPDFLLGATLMKYKSSLFIMTKDSSDFPLNIFELASYVNVIKRKSIHCYGIYSLKE